jgi:hypothetical protein
MKGGDGGTRKETRGRVKIKICIPPSRGVHVGNNLIAGNYYRTQQPSTTTQTCRDSFDKLLFEWTPAQLLQNP